MKNRFAVVTGLVALVAVAGALAWYLGDAGGPPETGVPPGLTAADVEAHNRAVGRMGRFEFEEAAEAFAALRERYPHWLTLKVNHAIALLNRNRPDTKDLDVALRLFGEVLERDPGDLRARHCSGMILLYRGRIEAARPCFERVATADESDAYAAYFLGECFRQVDEVETAISWFEQARARDPALRSAYHALSQAFRWIGEDAKADEMLATYRRFETNPQARVAEIKYTRMGQHGMVVAVDLPGAEAPPPPKGPIFLDPALLEIAGGAGLTWVANAEHASITAADIDGDGATDLLLTAVLHGDRPNLVLLRRGEGFEADLEHPFAGVAGARAALFGDTDNDGRPDVHFCCAGTNKGFRFGEDGAWTETTDPERSEAHDTTDGAMVDIDHDGDLDLLLLNADAGFEVRFNKGDGTFAPIPEEAGLNTDGRFAKGVVLGDFDRDRDLDLLLLHGEAKHEVFLNDRLWNWRSAEGFEALLTTPAHAGVAMDADADGQEEIYLATNDKVLRWAPDESGAWQSIEVTDVKRSYRWVHLGVLDAEGDGSLELLVNDGGGPRLVSPLDGALRFGKPEQDLSADPRCIPFFWSAGQGMALVGLSPSGAPLIWKPGPGRHGFAGLAFSGKHKQADSMRSNASGIGTRAAVRVDSKWTVRSTYRNHSGPGQSLQPICVGTVGLSRVDFVDLLWTDGLVQTEIDLEGGALHRIEETQRQTSSCPVLFVWDGSRYAFVSDVLGVGGMGFWVAPDTYPPPTPRESFLLPAGLLKPKGSSYVLKIGEPMEEGCYLDGAVLDAYDLPPGWKITLDERMQVEGPAPTGDVVFYRREANPVQALDQDGEDVLGAIRTADLVAAPVAALDPRHIGRTNEQVLTLTFDRALDEGAGRPVLVTDGWIEYPYAQTMFAAWQAQASYDAPTVEARGADGAWAVVLKSYGYPAGMPRQSSVPLGGLPKGTKQLRIRTNQEIYWDRLFVAYAEDCPTFVTHELGLAAATLSEPGFARRVPRPQRRPDYDYARRAPLWDTRHQAGWYTRFGDVLDLVRDTDDAVVVFGPGEEVELRFPVVDAALEEGWTRRFVLTSTGWCKDMDLFTKDGETVGPMPTRAVRDVPDPEVERLHRAYQTRYRSGR